MIAKGYPVSGSMSAPGDTSATPYQVKTEIGHPINLHLSGTWTGSVRLQRKLPGEASFSNLTSGGNDYGLYTSNINEAVWAESEDGANFILVVTISSGTLNYRISG